MENYYAASYPDSVHSSPRSRDIDFEHPPPQWEDTNNTFNNNNTKVKFMCSYGGKIQPRPHDNNLSYVGGETKIISVDRSVSLSSFLLRLRSVLSSAPDAHGVEVSFKYQLPGEDLDALISVTNDDDLNHMMSEYDRLCRSAPSKPARLRLFLFTVPSPQPPPPARDEKKFPVVAPTPVAATAPPNDAEFLFGLGKPFAQLPKPRDPVAVPEPQISADRVSSPDQHMVPPDIERHIRDLQRLQIQEQAAFQLQQRRGDERVEYYAPNPQEKSPPSNFPLTGTGTPPVYWTENQVGGAVGYPAASGGERPFYVVPAASAGAYHPPPSGGHAQPPQGFYPPPIQRMGSDVYRELPATYGVFAAASGPAPPQPAKVVGYSEGVGMGMGRQAAEVGYAQVAYDSAGRQVYYTSPYPGMAAVSADMMRQQQQSGPFSSDGNSAPKVSQNSM